MENIPIPEMELNRKKLLKSKDLERLQEEFMKEHKENKTKICVKFKKENLKENKQNIVNPNNFNSMGNTIILNEDLNTKKKKKDIIQMDLQLFNKNPPNKVTMNKDQTIFSKNINIHKSNQNFDFKEIDKNTGLPKIFDNSSIYLGNSNEKENLSNDIEMKKTEQNRNQINKVDNFFSLEKSLTLKNQEYKNIHEKNLELISNMSKEDLIINIESIKSKIPSDLLEKMKTGFFQKKLEGNLSEIEKKNLNIEKYNNESFEEDDNEKDEIIEINQPYNGKIIKTKTILLFDIEGKSKFIDENDDDFGTINEKLDYINMKFEDINIDRKKFTFKEILNLLQASHENLVIFGLKILFNLLNKNLHEVLFSSKGNTFSENVGLEILKEIKDCNLIYNLFYMIEHRNLNIRMNSLKNLNKIIGFFFDSNIKSLKTNLKVSPFFPIIKTNIINISSESQLESNFTEFKKNFFSFDYFQKFFDENFLYNFYFIKKSLENYSAILKIDKNTSNTSGIIENFSDKNLFIEYFEFLKLNVYYSDHFTVKFINSEVMSYTENFLQNLQNLNLSDINNLKIKKILKNIFVFVCLNNFEVDFINEKLKSLSKNFEMETFRKLNVITKSVLKILFFFKTLKENFFQFEFDYYLSTLIPSNKFDILIFIRLINEKNLENLVSFYKSGNISSNSLDFNLLIKKNYDGTINEFSIRKYLNKISLLLRLKIKLIKYITNIKFEDYIYFFNDESELNIFREIFEKICNYFKTEIRLILNNRHTITQFNLELINYFLVFLNQTIKLNFITNKYPKSSNYKKIFVEENFLQVIENFAIELFDYLNNLKIQILSSDNIKKKQTHINKQEESILDMKINKDKNENEFNIKVYKIRFLAQTENFLNFFINYLKIKTKSIEIYFNKGLLGFERFNNPIFLKLISEIPNLINIFGESQYLKYLKYFEKLINLKYLFYKTYNQNFDCEKKIYLSNIFEENKIKNFEKVFERISDSLKIFLNSNEDLRKSYQAKKIFEVCENLSKDTIYYNDFTKPNKSKYFPLLENNICKNFMIQIFTNEKIESELKLNFLFVYIILFFNENGIESISSEINHFNILLKMIINFHDKIYKNFGEILIDEYIKFFIFNRELNEFSNPTKLNFKNNIFNDIIKKNFDNEIDFEIFYSKFNDFYNDESEELNLYYKLTLVLFIFFNSYDFISMKNSKKYMNKLNVLEKKEDSSLTKNMIFTIQSLINVFESKYFLLLEYSYYSNLKFLSCSKIGEESQNSNRNLIKYLICNLDFNNCDLYEILFNEFLKFFSFDQINIRKKKKNLVDEQIYFDNIHKSCNCLNIKFYKETNLLFDFTAKLLEVFDIARIYKKNEIWCIELYLESNLLDEKNIINLFNKTINLKNIKDNDIFEEMYLSFRENQNIYIKEKIKEFFFMD